MEFPDAVLVTFLGGKSLLHSGYPVYSETPSTCRLSPPGVGLWPHIPFVRTHEEHREKEIFGTLGKAIRDSLTELLIPQISSADLPFAIFAQDSIYIYTNSKLMYLDIRGASYFRKIRMIIVFKIRKSIFGLVICSLGKARHACWNLSGTT